MILSLSLTVCGGVFDTNYPNLKIWLKADAGVTSSGGIVSSWADQASGAGQGVNNGTAVGSPTLVTSTILNNKPAIRFNGTNQGFDLAVDLIGSVWNYPGYCTIYAVIVPTTTTGVRDIINSGANILYVYNGALSFQIGGGNWDAIRSSAGSISNSKPYIVCFYRQGPTAGETRLFLNGNQNDNNSAIPNLDISSGTVMNVAYQATWGPNRYFAGDIAEILVYHEPLSSYNLNYVGYYLKTKYNIPSSYTLPGPPPVIPPSIDRTSPANKDINIEMDTYLEWDVLNATSGTHFDVYLGADFNTVNNADDTDTTGIYRGNYVINNYDPCGLKLGQFYYWRVDIIEGSNTSKGEVLSFAVKKSIVLENFDNYANTAALTAAWDANITLETGPHYTLGDGNSAKIVYDNSASPYFRQTTLNYSSDQNWTHEGVDSLSLYWRGIPSSHSEQVYVELKDADGNTAKRVFYNGTSEWWKKLVVEYDNLAGIDLSRIRAITIGIRNANQTPGSNGTVYFDDIVLGKRGDNLAADMTCDGKVDYDDLLKMAQTWLDSYNYTQDPRAANLVLWYKFNEGSGTIARDSSGGGYHAAINKDTCWDSGSLNFDGSLKVTVLNAGQTFKSINNQATIAAWVNCNSIYGTWNPWFHATKAGVNRIFMGTLPTPAGEIMMSMGANPNEYAVHDNLWWTGSQPSDYYNLWHHFAFTKNANTGQMKMYGDGQVVCEATGYWPMSGVEACVIGGEYGNSAGCTGKIADVRVYNCVLTQQEIQGIINETNTYQPLAEPQADVYGDGKINFKDYSVLANEWLKAMPYSHFSTLNDIPTLVVDNNPFIIVGAQCDIWRSTKQDQRTIEFFQGFHDMNATTVGIGIPWSKIEPTKDHYDFSFLQWFIDQAENNGLKLGINLFNTNICGTYVVGVQFPPNYILQDTETYQHMIISAPGYTYSDGGPALCPNDKDTLEREKKYVAAVANYLKQYDTRHTVVIIQINNEYYYRQFIEGWTGDTTIRCQCTTCNAKFNPSLYDSGEDFMHHSFAKYTKVLSDTIAEIYDLPLYVNSPWWPTYIIPIFLNNCPNLDLVGIDGISTPVQPNWLSNSQLSRNIPFAAEGPTESPDTRSNLGVLPYYTIFNQMGIGNLLWECGDPCTVVYDPAAKETYRKALYPIKNAMVPLLRARGTENFVGWYASGSSQFFVRQGLLSSYVSGTFFQKSLGGFLFTVSDGSKGGFIIETEASEIIIGASSGTITITGPVMTAAWQGIFQGENWIPQNPITIPGSGTSLSLNIDSPKVIKIIF